MNYQRFNKKGTLLHYLANMLLKQNFISIRRSLPDVFCKKVFITLTPGVHYKLQICLSIYGSRYSRID